MPNTNLNDTNNETALTLTGNVIGQNLTAEKFNALDDLIQKLGDRSTELQPEEKTAAIEVVEDWTKSVTSRIQENATRAANMLHFLSGRTIGGAFLTENIEMFHEVIGDTPEYLNYVAAVEELEMLEQDRPIPIPVSPAMTVTQAEQTEIENHAADTKFERKILAAEYKVNRAVKAYIQSLNSMPAIQTVKANLTTYKRKATRMANDCRDKGARAKLNITISDKETRSILQDMMDFTEAI